MVLVASRAYILLPALETRLLVMRCNRQTLDSLAGTTEGSYAGFHLTTSGGPLEIQDSDHKVIWGYGNNPFTRLIILQQRAQFIRLPLTGQFCNC